MHLGVDTSLPTALPPRTFGRSSAASWSRFTCRRSQRMSLTPLRWTMHDGGVPAMRACETTPQCVAGPGSRNDKRSGTSSVGCGDTCDTRHKAWRLARSLVIAGESIDRRPSDRPAVVPASTGQPRARCPNSGPPLTPSSTNPAAPQLVVPSPAQAGGIPVLAGARRSHRRVVPSTSRQRCVDRSEPAPHDQRGSALNASRTSRGSTSPAGPISRWPTAAGVASTFTSTVTAAAAAA